VNPPIPGKYTSLLVNFAAKAEIIDGNGANLQCWVDEIVNGKEHGLVRQRPEDRSAC
jgi:hypothetical protein